MSQFVVVDSRVHSKLRRQNEYRHDVRLSVKFPSVSSVDSKLGRLACRDYARYA